MNQEECIIWMISEETIECYHETSEIEGWHDLSRESLQ